MTVGDQFVFRDPKIAAANLTVYDARNHPFGLYGLYRPEEPGLFKRMPREVAENTGKRVAKLYSNTAGARLRFATDSSCIAVGAVYPPMEFPSARTAAFAAAGALCFDLYADGKYCRVLWPEGLNQRGSVVSFDIPDGQYEAFFDFWEKKLRQITLNFPSFVNISDVYIGLEEGAVLAPGQAYVNENPVVFYGSSITQGACASHPGNIYQNILSRKLNFDYVNLGFAGAARAEDAVIDYICTLDMCMLVFDYDHNARSPEFLESTHLPALRKLRAAHPDIPFILMSRPDQDAGEEDALRRVEVIERSYQDLLAESDAPVYFVNGQQIFYSHDSEMMTIDGTHPTDLGFHCMAEALYDVMEPYFL